MQDEIRQITRINTDLWEIFKAKYEAYTGKRIEYDINDLNSFIDANLADNNFPDYFHKYLDFSIAWIASRITTALSKAIAEIAVMQDEDIDLKSKFVIFDRLVKQLSELTKIKKRLQEEQSKSGKTDTTKKENIDYSRLL